MFKKPTHRQYIIRRVALALLATTSVLIIVTVTIFLMLGYRLDSGSGKLSQGALLQFDSAPNSAEVKVDGLVLGSRTPTKQTVIAGRHTVQMTKDRYETWERSLTLDAGTLTWLDYTRFVPKVRTAETVLDYPSLVSLKISADQKWALAQEKADSPVFQLIDLRSEAVKSSLVTVPSSLYTNDATSSVEATSPVGSSFTITAWNKAGRYAIVKHNYANQTEWLLVDTQDISRSVNITRTMSVGFNDLQFIGTGGSALYGLASDGVIRKLDLAAGTISRSLVSHVESFAIYDGTVITYIGLDPNNPSQRVAGVYRDGEEKAHVVYSVEANGEGLLVTTGKYFSDNYVVVAHGKTVEVFKGDYPSSSSDDSSSLKSLVTLEASSAVTSLSMSPEGDYILAQSNTTFLSYELEHNRLANGTVVATDGQPAPQLHWLTPAQLWNDGPSGLVMRDFDGVYANSIMSVESGFDASLSQNGRFFYGVSKTNGTYHLQRVKMILD